MATDAAANVGRDRVRSAAALIQRQRLGVAARSR
jgi:hypothetical protein